jgi:hypothetical protein
MLAVTTYLPYAPSITEHFLGIETGERKIILYNEIPLIATETEEIISEEKEPEDSEEVLEIEENKEFTDFEESEKIIETEEEEINSEINTENKENYIPENNNIKEENLLRLIWKKSNKRS